MPFLHSLTLRCQHPERQRQFYCEILGMAPRADGTIGYGAGQAGLLFEAAETAYQPTRTDLYWKIALAVPDIELACAQLKKAGVAVRGPGQFEDVGYLAHFEDPDGFSVELIDHCFKGNRTSAASDQTRFGGGASFNLVTLRAEDMTPLRPVLEAWGMVPLSVQPLRNYGFTLHFFAFTEDRPPNPDLTAVENREWLYQRSYTVLEVQEVHDGAVVTALSSKEAGFAGIQVKGLTENVDFPALGVTGTALPPR